MPDERSQPDPPPEAPGDQRPPVPPAFHGSAQPDPPQFVGSAAAGPPRFVGYPAPPDGGGPSSGTSPGGFLSRWRRRLGRNAH